MLSTVAIAIAFAISKGVSPRSLPALAAAEIASCVAWLKPFAITGTAAENLHWIAYATASASMNSSPDAPVAQRGENGPQVVTRVTESARRHVAVKQIYVAHKT